METICKKHEKCPIFNGILKGKDITTRSYKQLYCENSEGWINCKRYQVSEKIGSCPSNLLPNSFKDVDTIISEIKNN